MEFEIETAGRIIRLGEEEGQRGISARSTTDKLEPAATQKRVKSKANCLQVPSKRSEATRRSCSREGMLRLRRSSASLHSDSALHDNCSGYTEEVGTIS